MPAKKKRGRKRKLSCHEYSRDRKTKRRKKWYSDYNVLKVIEEQKQQQRSKDKYKDNIYHKSFQPPNCLIPDIPWKKYRCDAKYIDVGATDWAYFFARLKFYFQYGYTCNKPGNKERASN